MSITWQKFQLTHSRGVRPCRWAQMFSVYKFQLTHSRGVRLDLLSYIPAAGKNFNSRTHVECDFLPYRFVCVSLWISTHALTWSATGLAGCGGADNSISTHALTWSATDFARFAAQPEKFQLTHSRGVRPLAAGFAYLYQNFNSRTHVECDRDGATPAADCTKISTHALTWSATKTKRDILKFVSFQLTHSRGVRHESCFIRQLDIQISTHALTWSATDVELMARNESYDFNSRTHVECDVTGAFQRPGHQGFQLTHSRGVRLGAMAIDILALGISTHALTWSATIPGYSPARFLYISTHALTWSATEENLITLLIIKISTHALTWSATISSTVIIIPHFISTHALTWSATKLV